MSPDLAMKLYVSRAILDETGFLLENGEQAYLAYTTEQRQKHEESKKERGVSVDQ